MSPSPRPTNFRQRVEQLATAVLSEAVPRAQVAQAVARVSLAFAAAHRTARKPEALEACTDASIGSCIALSALTNLMPGGSHALVYLVPQSARKGETPELQWRPTHRGYAALALEDAGLVLLPVAVYDGDVVDVRFGEIADHQPTDLPGTEIIGAYVTIRRAADGVVLSRPWVPRRTIDRARESSRSGDAGPWATHPEEMTLAAAIRWCHGRGMIPSTSARLSSAMVEEGTEDAAALVAEVRRPAIARPRPVAALPAPVEEPEEARRETITVAAAGMTDEEAP